MGLRARALLGFSEETSQASRVRSRGFRRKGNELLLMALVIESRRADRKRTLRGSSLRQP
jgi:hypothetical protein